MYRNQNRAPSIVSYELGIQQNPHIQPNHNQISNKPKMKLFILIRYLLISTN